MPRIAGLLALASLLALCAVLTAACAGQRVHLLSADGPGGFSLNVLPESHLDAASRGAFSLSVASGNAGAEVRIAVAGAAALKAAYFTLDYDPARYTPLSAAPGEALAGLAPRGELLFLSVLDEPGRVQCGQVLPRWEASPGFRGSGVIARVQFAARPFTKPRSASTPPNSALSAVTLYFDLPTTTLSWRFRAQGDYNQDGLVGITDLTPLGTRFGQSVTYPAEADTAKSCVDGNEDGVLNVADVSPIGMQFGKNMLGGWNVYRSANPADYPPDWTSGNGGAAPPGNVARNAYDPSTNPATDRVLYTFPVVGHTAGDGYWVRPMDGSGVEGIPSNLRIPGGVNNDPLISGVDYSVNPVASGAGCVILVSATDPDGDPIAYSATPDQGTIVNGDSRPESFVFAAPVVAVDTVVNVTYQTSDGHGGNDAYSGAPITVLAPAGGNSPPVISSVIATPLPVPSGGTGTLICNASDPDGDPLTYSWVVNGDLGYALGNMSVAQYIAPTVSSPQSAFLVVFVDDGHGNYYSDASTLLSVIPAVGSPPSAAFNTQSGTGVGVVGTAPHCVLFDGTLSSDPDGDPLTYEWVYGDSSPSGSGATSVHSYIAGFFYPRLKVSDGTYTATSDTVGIQVNDPGVWSVQTIDALDDAGKYCSLASIGSRPAVAYRMDGPGGSSLQYMSSTSYLGIPGTWGFGVAPGVSPLHISLAEVEGQPAIAYYEAGIVVPLLAYTRYDGVSAWSTPLQLDADNDSGNGCALQVANGAPRIAYIHVSPSALVTLRIVSANDATGASWGAPIATFSAGSGSGARTSMAVTVNPVGGDFRAGISYYRDNQTLCFALPSDSTYTYFSQWLAHEEAGVDVGRYSSMAVFNGLPAIAYYASSPSVNRVDLVQATVWGGSFWAPAATTVAADAAGDLSMAIIDGQPAIAYYSLTGNLHYIRSSSFQDWQGGMDAGTVDSNPSEDLGRYCCLKDISGHPAIAYYDATHNDLKFAIRYQP